MEKTGERRKNRRYRVNERSFAATGIGAQTLGQIIDISLGGACFKYMDSYNDDGEGAIGQTSSVLLGSRGCFVEDLSGKIVGDYSIIDVPSFSNIGVRKMHFEFMELNTTQMVELRDYIKNSVSEKEDGKQLNYLDYLK